MTDYSRDRLGPDDEDRLPWLEPVEEEPEEGGISTGRLILWAVAALLLIGMVVGGYFWMRGNDRAASGEGALIEAPDSYYKERPAAEAPATRDDEIVYSASKGDDLNSMIDISGAAETPVNVDRPPAAAPASPPAAKAAQPRAPAAKAATGPALPKAVKAPPKPPEEAPAPSSGGSTIQLGAFSSPAKANAAWKSLSGRFSFLSGLTQSVAPVQSGDKTLYRLRASGGNAGDLCGRLRTAGESCSVIG